MYQFLVSFTVRPSTATTSSGWPADRARLAGQRARLAPVRGHRGRGEPGSLLPERGLRGPRRLQGARQAARTSARSSPRPAPTPKARRGSWGETSSATAPPDAFRRNEHGQASRAGRSILTRTRCATRTTGPKRHEERIAASGLPDSQVESGSAVGSYIGVKASRQRRDLIVRRSPTLRIRCPLRGQAKITNSG